MRSQARLYMYVLRPLTLIRTGNCIKKKNTEYDSHPTSSWAVLPGSFDINYKIATVIRVHHIAHFEIL